jgi:hypothetical protein
MYFATYQMSFVTDSYISFLKDIIDNGNRYYEEVIKDVLSQTKSLIDTGDFYSVSSERFEIVNLLSKHPDFIKKLDFNCLQTNDFERLLEYLQKDSKMLV